MQGFTFIESLAEKHINQLYDLLQQTWWAKGRSMHDVMIMLNNCMSFGIVEDVTQDLIGYARVLTDEIKYAFIFDVMVNENFRGKRLGKMLMEKIISHPRLANVKNFDLTCAPDMISYYEQFEFSQDYGTQSKPMRYVRKDF